MLIQITNKCYENCSHCLQDSSVIGQHMSDETFEELLKFVKKVDPMILAISGGEPTAHPKFYEICKRLDDLGIVFTICSNGTWIFDKELEEKVNEVLKMKMMVAMQVYSHPDFYKDYQQISSYNFPESVVVTTDKIRAMQDLGRAKHSTSAQEYIKNEPHYMSCLNTALVAKQVDSFHSLLSTLEMSAKYCKPLVDWKGEIHMSESWLCQSIGHISESPEVVFERMKKFKPCGGCKNYKIFMKDNSPRVMISKQILGL